MPEIKPDLADKTRCISVHWNLPVQCVLPVGHRENWHEAWRPQTGNRIRYRRSGMYRTEELNDGWRDLEIPPPGGFCNDQFVSTFGDSPNVRCTEQYGHGWNHRAVVDGCTYSWNTPVPKDLTVDQLTRDVKQLRGMLVDAHARIAELEAGPTLPWAHAMPDDDLHGFLNDLLSAAADRWRSDPEVPDRDVLANVEKACAAWRTPGQGYRSDDAEGGAA